MITSTMYVLAVPSLARSAEFYRDMLGFDVREMGDPGWRMFVRDSCWIMAGECPDAIPPAELGVTPTLGTSSSMAWTTTTVSSVPRGSRW
jgi:catechol 2,3-dioxygenase-like lactoylglutathione lyase family enzyme